MINKKREIIKKKIIQKLSQYIKKGDVINCEFDLAKFKLVSTLSENKSHFIDFFIEIFLELIGPKGTLIVPTFSYSWGLDKKIKIFDINKTKPTVGILPGYLMSLPNTTRTIDPMFSFVVIGNKKKYFTKNSNNSFGKNSVFEKILKEKGKLISFGLNQFDPTFVHYVEQYFDENYKRLKYRYLKKFSGIIINKKKIKKKAIFFSFVRHENSNVIFDGNKIKNSLIKSKKLKKFKNLKNDVYIVNSQDFYKNGIKGLKKNNNYFVK